MRPLSYSLDMSCPLRYTGMYDPSEDRLINEMNWNWHFYRIVFMDLNSYYLINVWKYSSGTYLHEKTWEWIYIPAHLLSEWELGLESLQKAQGLCHVVFEASEVFFYVTRNAFATSSSINRGKRQQHFSCDFFLLQKHMRQQNFFFWIGTFAGINKNHENSHLYLTQSWRIICYF